MVAVGPTQNARGVGSGAEVGAYPARNADDAVIQLVALSAVTYKAIAGFAGLAGVEKLQRGFAEAPSVDERVGVFADGARDGGGTCYASVWTLSTVVVWVVVEAVCAGHTSHIEGSTRVHFTN